LSKLVPQDPDDGPAEALLRGMHEDSTRIEFGMEGLPRGWVSVSLSCIAQINPSKPKKDLLPDNLEVSFVPMKNVSEMTGVVDLSKTRKYHQVRQGYTYFANDDIIFAKITPCMENGKVAVASELKNGIGFGSTEFHVIRLMNNLSRKFYFFYLIQNDFRKMAALKMKGTAGQLRVPTNLLEMTLVPLPPLAEQRRIVSKIESILARIDACRQKLLALQERTQSGQVSLAALRDSVLKQAFEGRLVPQDPDDEPAEVLLRRMHGDSKDAIFEKRNLPKGWALTKLMTITDYVQKINPKETPDKWYYYCDIDSIDNSKQQILNPKYIVGSDAPSRARQLLKTNDILFSTVRTYLKNIAIVSSDLEGHLASTGFCVIRSKINSRLVFYYVQTKRFLDSLNRVQRGTSYPAVRNNDVVNMIIPIPPAQRATPHRLQARINPFRD